MRNWPLHFNWFAMLRPNRPPKPPVSCSPLPGATPCHPPSLVEADLLRWLALLSPGDDDGNGLLSDFSFVQWSKISSLKGGTAGGGMTTCGAASCPHGPQHGES